MGLHSFAGPDTPTTAQLVERLHADLKVPHVNVFKMKEVPAGAHPKVERAFRMFKTLPDLWRTQFAPLLASETLGLRGSRGMSFDAEGFDAYMASLEHPDALTLVLRETTNVTIDNALREFGMRCKAAIGTGDEAGSMAERYGEADTLMSGVITNPHTLSAMREPRWGTEAASRQGFRAARDAEWRLQGVFPRVATVNYEHDLNEAEARALSGDGIAGTLGALADCHEDVFLAIRRVLRGTPDHALDVPYQPENFVIADRGEGKLTLDISQRVFDIVRGSELDIDGPWTGCPAIPFIRQYHLWSSMVAGKHYLPHIPRLQAKLRARSAVPKTTPVDEASRPGTAPHPLGNIKL